MRGKDRHTIRDPLADGRCTLPLLNSRYATDAGRLSPDPTEGDTQSEVSEWKLWERRGREEKRRVEAEELVEERPLFSLRQPSWRLQNESRMWRRTAGSFVLSSVFPSRSPWCTSYFLGTGLGEGGELATCRLRAGCGRETDAVFVVTICEGRVREMNNPPKN